jgi:hypothetical protein
MLKKQNITETVTRSDFCRSTMWSVPGINDSMAERSLARFLKSQMIRWLKLKPCMKPYETQYHMLHVWYIYVHLGDF